MAKRVKEGVVAALQLRLFTLLLCTPSRLIIISCLRGRNTCQNDGDDKQPSCGNPGGIETMRFPSDGMKPGLGTMRKKCRP